MSKKSRQTKSKITLESLAAMVARGFADMATKSDIAAIRSEMATKTHVDSLKDEMNKRFVGLAVELGKLQNERIVSIEHRLERLEKQLKR